MQTPSDQVCTIRLFPSEDATFDSDSMTAEARWQYYVASYTMTEATEGIDQGRMQSAYLRRNVAPQHANIETAYEEVYGNLDHFDEQTAFISPETYKLLLNKDFRFSRLKADDSTSARDYEVGKVEENEKFRERYRKI